MANVKVSIIVPVYNVQRYLPQCLASLRAQTLPDIEIICVDDGSTDGSGAVLAAFAKLDQRIRVVTTENHGVSAARNVALDIARGDYLMFVDADDLLEAHACETVCRIMDASAYDLIKFSATPFPAGLTNPWLDSVTSLPSREFLHFEDDVMFFEPCRPFIWNGAYRRSFIEGPRIRFIEGLPLGEDQVFSFATIGRASSFAFVPDRLYRYRVMRADSATLQLSENRVGKIWEHMRVLEAIIDDWRLQEHMSGYSARRMIYFGIDFILPDIFEVADQETRCELVGHFRDIFLYRFTREDIAAWMMDDPLRPWALAICDFSRDVESFDLEASYRYIADRNNAEAAEEKRAADLERQRALQLSVLDRAYRKVMGETPQERKDRKRLHSLLAPCDQEADAAYATFLEEAKAAGLAVDELAMS